MRWSSAENYRRCQRRRSAGRRYRLPSEAQWEYACRAGSTGRYGFSSGGKAIPKEYEEHELSDYGWFRDNADGMTHAVGGKRPNAWGLHDMHGNVWEWCQDWYDKDYYANIADGRSAGAFRGLGPRDSAAVAGSTRRGTAGRPAAFSTSSGSAASAPGSRGAPGLPRLLSPGGQVR